jgi:hypothetical protein
VPTTVGRRYPKGVWPRVRCREASEEPFRSTVGFEERRGVGASMGPLREDGRGACLTPFVHKWLKWSSTH